MYNSIEDCLNGINSNRRKEMCEGSRVLELLREFDGLIAQYRNSVTPEQIYDNIDNITVRESKNDLRTNPEIYSRFLAYGLAISRDDSSRKVVYDENEKYVCFACRFKEEVCSYLIEHIYNNGGTERLEIKVSEEAYLVGDILFDITNGMVYTKFNSTKLYSIHNDDVILGLKEIEEYLKIRIEEGKMIIDGIDKLNVGYYKRLRLEDK